MTTDGLRQSILKRYPEYKQGSLDKILVEIEGMDAQLRTSLEEFLDSGRIPETKIEGHSVEDLMKAHGMNVIAAVLTMAWLKRDPEKAKDSLTKGHDRIVF